MYFNTFPKGMRTTLQTKHPGPVLPRTTAVSADQGGPLPAAPGPGPVAQAQTGTGTPHPGVPRADSCCTQAAPRRTSSCASGNGRTLQLSARGGRRPWSRAETTLCDDWSSHSRWDRNRRGIRGVMRHMRKAIRRTPLAGPRSTVGTGRPARSRGVRLATHAARSTGRMSRAGMMNGASEVDATLPGTERGPRRKSLVSLLGTIR